MKIKFIVFISTFILAQLCLAVELKILNPCNGEVEYNFNQVISNQELNLGEFSVQAFEDLDLPYQGSAHSIQSLLESPTGMEAMEVISDREMRAYGWCYQINGQVPELMPDQIQLEDQDEVIWYFAFAHYLDGAWVGQCVPAHSISNNILCQ